MSDPADQNVSDATRVTEAEDEQLHGGADREPTPEEEAAAEAVADLDPSVAENYERQAKLGADIKGEGEIS